MDYASHKLLKSDSMEEANILTPSDGVLNVHRGKFLRQFYLKSGKG